MKGKKFLGYGVGEVDSIRCLLNPYPFLYCFSCVNFQDHRIGCSPFPHLDGIQQGLIINGFSEECDRSESPCLLTGLRIITGGNHNDGYPHSSRRQFPLEIKTG